MKASIALASPIESEEPVTKDKDGNGGDNGVTQYVIDVATNGYVLTMILDDGGEVKSVFEDFDKLLNELRSSQ